jgi:hypothetical protein
MTNQQLIEAIKEVYGLINPDTTPRFDDQGGEVSDGAILDRIFAIVQPIIRTV